MCENVIWELVQYERDVHYFIVKQLRRREMMVSLLLASRLQHSVLLEILSGTEKETTWES